VLAADDDPDPVEDAVVGLDLGGQTPQGVAVALDLEAFERAVDEPDVDPWKISVS
jgi:hypothetical protein